LKKMNTSLFYLFEEAIFIKYLTPI